MGGPGYDPRGPHSLPPRWLEHGTCPGTEGRPRQTERGPRGRAAVGAELGHQLKSGHWQGGRVACPRRVSGAPAAEVCSGLLRRSGSDLQDSCYPLPAGPLTPICFLVLFCCHLPGAEEGEGAPLKSLPPSPVSLCSPSPPLLSISYPWVLSGLMVGCLFADLGVRVAVGCWRQKGPQSCAHAYGRGRAPLCVCRACPPLTTMR